MARVGYTLLIAMVPAPAPVIEAVQDIEIEASLDQASVFRVRFGITQTKTGDWSILELDPFRPLVPVSIRVQRGIRPPEAVINGYVTDQRVIYGHEASGCSTLEVTGMDATHLMNLQERVKPWPNLPDSGIAAAIFGQYGVVPRLDATSPVLTEPDGTTIQRGTDIRFLRRLARRNGFDCYVQPEPVSGLDFGHFRARRTAGLPQAVLSVSMGEETNVHDFAVRYEMTKPTTAVAAGLDVATKAPQPALAPVPSELPLGLEGTLMRELPPAVVRPADTGLPRTAELQRAAQAVVSRSSWSVVATGTVGTDVGVLRPGGLVNVRGAGRVYNGSYVVTRVTHSLAPCAYEQRFEARRNAVAMTGGELFVEVA
jgi:phage protein D